jgi:hypothetical protein
MEAKGFVKPIVASLAGDVEVEEAAEYLYQNGIPAYAYSTELPVEVLVLLRQKRQRIRLGADDGRWMSETVFAARTSRERSDESGHQALSHGRD